MKTAIIAAMMILLALTGCQTRERLNEGAENEKALGEKAKKYGIKVNPGETPVGISDVFLEVEGRRVLARDENKTWHVDCSENGCKPKLGPKPKKK